MGRLVQLWKVEDSENVAVYCYGSSKEKSGRLKLSKKDQVVSCVEPVPGLSEKEERFHFRDLATVKLQMLAAKGSFPDETYIAT
jgi:hypothetical protein